MKVLVVGAGGIGSFWIDAVCDPDVKESQVPDAEIWLADDDIVETRNLLYQNFDEVHAQSAMMKTQALVESGYEIDGLIEERITTVEQMEGFDVVISCVDNVEFRRMMFKNQDQIPFWIDLRAEGRIFMFLNKDAGLTTDQLLSITKHPKNPENANRGCALEADLTNNRLQFGNRLAALAGAQAFFNHYRGISKPLKERIYL